MSDRCSPTVMPALPRFWQKQVQNVFGNWIPSAIFADEVADLEPRSLEQSVSLVMKYFLAVENQKSRRKSMDC